MENSFGSDFSNVNMHTNNGSATEMGALAYTQGDSVHFAPGQYNPSSQKGQELLGHELAHVVQQRQGKVQPTTQRKGSAVNDSPALENEADVMGAKAAQGKDASEVAGRGSGVQRKDDKVNILLQDKLFGKDVILYGMNSLGSFSYISAMTGKRVNEHVLTGTKEQWALMLKYADSGSLFMTYIIGFLKACNNPSWKDKGDPNPWKGEKRISVSRNPSDSEKLEFLKALYGVDIDSNLDLVNHSLEKGLSSLENVTHSELARFIAGHQHMLIEYASQKGKNQHIKSKGIATLANQGTPNVFEPKVVKAMMQNAFSTAVSASKLIISDSVKSGTQMSSRSAMDAFDTVANSAIILKSTISSYGKRVQSLKDGVGTVFDSVWGFIPIPGNKVASLIAGQAQGILKNALVSSLSFPDTSNLNEEYSRKYSSAIKEMANKILAQYENELDKDKFINSYRDLITVFEAFID